MGDEQRFLELIKISNSLRRNGKFLELEDPQADKILLKFLVSIEKNFRYVDIEIYIELCNDFIAEEINAEDFCRAFRGLYMGASKKVKEMKKKESLELLNWMGPTNLEIDDLLSQGCGLCTNFISSPEINIDEKNLRKYARNLVIELQQLKV